MKIGVIADDLTGANATGVRLTKQGFQAATMVHFDQPISNDYFNTVCVDTDSRYARKDIATSRVQKVLGHFKSWGVDVVCKRIDSTIRGNIGAEIDTVLNELGENSISIVVSSFPDSGRITSGGYLLVNGAPVQTTDVAKDPVMPLTQSYIPDIVQNQSIYPVSHIGLETVLEGENAIAQAIENKIAQGDRIIVLDAVTNEEIEEIANAMVTIVGYQMIPADPGPLTAAFSRAFTKQNVKGRKVIAAVGSVTSNSEKQMQYLIEKTNAEPIYVNARKLASDNVSWENEISRCVNEALHEMDKQEIIIITTMVPGAEQIDLCEVVKEEGNNQDYWAKRIADGLAKIVRITLEKSQYDVSGMFSSGGDVTASLCSVGGATGIKLIDEVMPLVAYGQFIGGHIDGIPIVTKGGLAGEKKAIYESIKHLLVQDFIPDSKTVKETE